MWTNIYVHVIYFVMQVEFITKTNHVTVVYIIRNIKFGLLYYYTPFFKSSHMLHPAVSGNEMVTITKLKLLLYYRIIQMCKAENCVVIS